MIKVSLDYSRALVATLFLLPVGVAADREDPVVEIRDAGETITKQRASEASGPIPTITLEEARLISSRFSAMTLEPPPQTALPAIEFFDPSRHHYDRCIRLQDRTQIETVPIASGQGRVRYLFSAMNAFKLFMQGDIPEANKDYAHAVVEWKRLYTTWPNYRGDKISESELHAEVALALAATGDFRSAEAALTHSRSGFRSRGHDRADWRHFRQERAAAMIALARGQPLVAEAHYRRALTALDVAEPSVHPGLSSYQMRTDLRHITHAELAQVLRHQGRLTEAELLVRGALSERADYAMRYSRVSAYVMVRFADVLFQSGRYDEAIAAARMALALYEKVCAPESSLFRAEARNIIGRTRVTRHEWPAALKEYETIGHELSKRPQIFARRFANSLSWSIALLELGHANVAKRKLERGIQMLSERGGVDNYDLQEYRVALSLARHDLGDPDFSFAGLRSALDKLISLASSANDTESSFVARDHRLAILIDRSIQLLATSGSDTAQYTFELAQAASARSVQRAFVANLLRAAVDDPQIGGLIRRKQDLGKRLTATRVSLSNLFFQQDNPYQLEALKTLRARIRELARAHNALDTDVRQRFPAYYERINPRPVPIDRVQALLNREEALLMVFTGAKNTYVWSVLPSGAARFHAAPVGRVELVQQIAELRAALDPEVEYIDEIPDFDGDLAHHLYQTVFAPVSQGWAHVKHLIVVADGPLGSLPMAVLPTRPFEIEVNDGLLFASYRNVSWLGRRHAFTRLPTVGTLAALRSQPHQPVPRTTFAGFGDPFFNLQQAAGSHNGSIDLTRGIDEDSLQIRGFWNTSPQTRNAESAELSSLPRLPDTAVELRAMAMALGADPSADVFLGERASESRVKRMDLSNRSVVAFATHGLAPGDLNGLVQPALGLSSPEVVGDNEDGLLTMGEIMSLELSAEWVVLSGCNTAAGYGDGTEAVSGLGRAFIYAGARAVLVSNWPVETSSARELTSTVFALQMNDSSLTRAQALQRSMLEMIDHYGLKDGAGKMLFSYAHPIFWAPFSLVGDGR